MAQLSWNEIQKRALEFSAKWQGETYEKGESQSFWSDFLGVFGIDRRRHGAYFEYAVKKIHNRQGYIDMFWPGILLAEQKSGGRDLSAANTQAFDYLHNLSDEELPQYIIVSDFNSFELVNLETRERTIFTLNNFPKRVKLFGFLIGRYSTNLQEEDPVNRKAAETMARLHNQLSDSNYKGHELEILLVRLVFCLFADDAGIFVRGAFEQYLNQRTSADGSDLGPRLGKIFEVLNTSENLRQKNLDEDLITLPYINGGLFAEITRMPDFSSEMRNELLSACKLDWSLVSPAIFGSMFQGVMDEEERRNLGAHYTSERNILKVIKALFLDQLYAEFHLIKHDKRMLEEYHNKIAGLTFLDPACGCGNFLVITYRELRKLEHQVLAAIHGKQALLTDITESIKVNVNQMNGIEIEEFPALIAETALWLTDHQMNLAASQQFGKHFVRLPLKARANIHNDDALELHWNDVIPAEKLNYILGNPPFSGSKLMNEPQRNTVRELFGNTPGSGLLDFVAAWYVKSAEYMKSNKSIQAALVSTSSITQGEQVSIIWGLLLKKGIVINFAHQTFKWRNEGKGVAAVYCVIIGFGYEPKKNKQLFTYSTVEGDPKEMDVKNINPYLADGPNVIIYRRGSPICKVPAMNFGNMPLDGGNLLLSDDEARELIKFYPEVEKYIWPFIGAKEFLNRGTKWCLWLIDASPEEIRALPPVLSKIEKVRQFRLDSKAPSTQKFAKEPALFRDRNNPQSFIVVPRVSSENRQYIPMGFFDGKYIAGDTCLVIPNADPYHFAILTSKIHMAWVRYVCGKLEGRYRYSKDIVYNNFPWPTKTDEEQKIQLEELASNIITARELYPKSSLADLYDPRSMPTELAKAHAALDTVVDKIYGGPYANDAERVEILFKLYAKLINKK